MLILGKVNVIIAPQGYEGDTRTRNRTNFLKKEGKRGYKFTTRKNVIIPIFLFS